MKELEKIILSEIAVKLGKIHTAKTHPPFKKVKEGHHDIIPGIVLSPGGGEFEGTPELDGDETAIQVALQNVNKANSETENEIEPEATDNDKTDNDKTDNDNNEEEPKKGFDWRKAALVAGGGYAAYKALQALKRYRDRKKRERQNDHFQPKGVQLNEGPSYEYKKHIKNIDKTSKAHQGAILDLYELLRKKGLDKEASMLLEAYKKNLVTFKKTYDKIMRKLV